MLESMKLLLELRGYDVRTYLRALDLLDHLPGVGVDDVVVSDYYLPDMNGVELAKRVRRERPRVRVLLLTGSREDGVAKAAQSVPDCKVMYKPLDVDALYESIARA